ESAEAIRSPTRYKLAGCAARTAQELLAVAEGEIKDGADNQPLRDILRGERTLLFQVVPVLDGPDTTSDPDLQPGSESISGGKKLGVGVSDKHGTAAHEPSRDRCLQRVIRTAAAALTVQVQSRILWEWPIKLAHSQTARRRRGRG